MHAVATADSDSNVRKVQLLGEKRQPGTLSETAERALLQAPRAAFHVQRQTSLSLTVSSAGSPLLHLPFLFFLNHFIYFIYLFYGENTQVLLSLCNYNKIML